MMSIVCLLGQTSQPPEKIAGALAIGLVLLTVASIALIARLAVFRRENVLGPSRWPQDEGAGLILGIALIAFVIWQLGSTGIYLALGRLSTQHRALLAGMLSGPILLGVLLAMNAALRAEPMRRLGMTRPGLGRGATAGAIGLMMVLPWIFWLMVAETAIVHRLGYQPQTMHPIFQALQTEQAGRTFEIIAMGAAVVIAPLAEETLFRGFVQTGIARLLMGRRWRPIPPAPSEPYVPPGSTLPPTLPPAQSPAQPPAVMDYAPRDVGAEPGALSRWVAIIITSLLFAAVHQPAFIIPPIFLLSLALGYVYERTGNLWSNIFLHMFFNAVQFSLFLITIRS